MEEDRPSHAREILSSCFERLLQKYPERSSSFVPCIHFPVYTEADEYGKKVSLDSGSPFTLHRMNTQNFEFLDYAKILFLPAVRNKVLAVALGEKYPSKESVSLVIQNQLFAILPETPYSALFLEYIPASFAEQILHLKETSSHVSGFAVTRCLEEILADGTRHFRAITFFAYDSSHATKVPFYVKQSPFHKKIQYVDPIYSSAWFHSYYGTPSEKMKLVDFFEDFISSRAFESPFYETSFSFAQKTALLRKKASTSISRLLELAKLAP